MKIKAILTIIISILACLGLASSLVFSKEKVMGKPDQFCSESGNQQSTLRILIIGESWAAKGRLLPYVNEEIAKNTNKHTIVCTVGFSGRNAEKLYAELSNNYSDQYWVKLLGSHPDKVILLTGVNDVVQHIGPDSYSKNLQKLINTFDKSKVYVMEIPNVDVFLNHGASIPRLAKRWGQWVLNDRMEENTVSLYRAHTSKTISNASIIPFNPFLKDYESNKSSYTTDGIHLTDKEFNRYGSYIGQYVSVH